MAISLGGVLAVIRADPEAGHHRRQNQDSVRVPESATRRVALQGGKMGRKPNPLILEFFERGPKLNDNSNRYPHTCRACGEHFAKGRIDSLTNHLTKKCPAISEADRINACLTLHGIHHASPRGQKDQVQANGPPVDLPMMQRDWTALETLAEVSRQIDLSEKHDDRSPSSAPPSTAAAAPGGQTHVQERFELAEPFNLETSPAAIKDSPQSEKQGDAKQPGDTDAADSDLITEERLQALLQSATSPSEAANLSMAAAATARLNTSLLDPQLRAEETAVESPAPLPALDGVTTAETPVAVPGTAPGQPWGEITYLADNVPLPSAQPEQAPSPSTLSKGGFRLDSPGSAKTRHSRARFDATRRKEVQEVRKIGACIRCRILRKTCSKGDPCDTCRKVLSPRIWRSGCVRTKFSEQLDLYSAGVQVVLAQHRINNLKAALNLVNNGLSVSVSHFPGETADLSFTILQSDGPKAPVVDDEAGNPWPLGSLVMINIEKEDVPAKVEAYMKDTVRQFIQREPSHFMKVTLETALKVAEDTNDELLKKAIELWGLVEILDRERQWVVTLKTTDGQGPRPIREDTDQDVYTTICLQLTAGAERKASAISKTLLTGMQRVLQDSKTKVGHAMFFTTLTLLICVEKSTWAFKAWEQDGLRTMWPLEKQPGNFTNQGYVLADLLRMLLSIRKAIPRTERRESDGALVTVVPTGEQEDPLIKGYFESLNLNFADVQAKQEHPAFSPTDSRSFELLFCSTLLLPARE
ncbi:uncharacterized protein E0L32_004908 [Thyridium curvatum]|uniref:Zn(2)-C6 fungal-type domain-containing protein n=1 Tax=Thyridium curvatum TaxID=1093900 RepID=A0A507BE62_9PEZI|nr:uncharacterized protein E0L32_004908 [Thyridium curvatum]TPX15078.1 hypothetical protein E0L32_004908 [Thyridium curvatum]